MNIKEEIEKIINNYIEWLISDKGLEHMGIKSQVKVRLPIKLVDELITLIEKERASAVRGFVEKGTEIQQDLAENGVIANIGLVYEEYLKTLDGSAEKHETPKMSRETHERLTKDGAVMCPFDLLPETPTCECGVSSAIIFSDGSCKCRDCGKMKHETPTKENQELKKRFEDAMRRGDFETGNGDILWNKAYDFFSTEIDKMLERVRLDKKTSVLKMDYQYKYNPDGTKEPILGTLSGNSSDFQRDIGYNQAVSDLDDKIKGEKI